jgi:hypothetical protein
MKWFTGRVSQDCHRIKALLDGGRTGAGQRGTELSNQGPGNRAFVSRFGEAASLE